MNRVSFVAASVSHVVTPSVYTTPIETGVAKTRVRVRPRVRVRVRIRIQKVSQKCIKANLKLLFRPN